MNATQYIYVMKGLRKAYGGGKVILDDVWLSFLPGAKIGVVGPNGAGKSTLLKIMAGLDQNFDGEAWPAKGMKVGYLAQEPQLDVSKTVLENITQGVAATKALLEAFEAVSLRFGEEMDDEVMQALIEEQAALQEKIEAVDGWSLDRQLEIAMDALRCPPADAAVDKLSGGEKRRVALCRLLLSKPDMLLLDEPTNHLDTESVAWLERYLRDYRGTVVCVTHDRYFLNDITEWILELDRGHAIPYEGNYTAWLEQRAARMAQEQRAEQARQKALREELDWIRQAPKARQAKSKARVTAYERLLNDSQQKRPDRHQIVIPPGPRLGQEVIEAQAIQKAFGDRLLIEDLSFRIPPGAIVGIIGPNGAGKTTLFRMITGADQPDKGKLKLGDTVKLGYVDQSRDALQDHQTVFESISEGAEEIDLGNQTMNARAYCGLFGFRGPDQQKRVGKLSGGERNRVHLARMLKSKANVILLDEPSNDLDVDTLRALEDGISDFPGCVLVTSHDRWFLDRLATHILAFEGDSQVVWFEGNYEAYEADRRRRLGGDADQPQRLKYKPLTR